MAGRSLFAAWGPAGSRRRLPAGPRSDRGRLRAASAAGLADRLVRGNTGGVPRDSQTLGRSADRRDRIGGTGRGARRRSRTAKRPIAFAAVAARVPPPRRVRSSRTSSRPKRSRWRRKMPRCTTCVPASGATRACRTPPSATRTGPPTWRRRLPRSATRSAPFILRWASSRKPSPPSRKHWRSQPVSGLGQHESLLRRAAQGDEAEALARCSAALAADPAQPARAQQPRADARGGRPAGRCPPGVHGCRTGGRQLQHGHRVPGHGASTAWRSARLKRPCASSRRLTPHSCAHRKRARWPHRPPRGPNNHDHHRHGNLGRPAAAAAHGGRHRPAARPDHAAAAEVAERRRRPDGHRMADRARPPVLGRRCRRSTR